MFLWLPWVGLGQEGEEAINTDAEGVNSVVDSEPIEAEAEVGQGPEYSEPERARLWSVFAGPAYRWGMDFDAEGTSWTQAMGIHAAQPYSREPATIGAAGSYDNRKYEGAYVRLDPGTNNPDSITPGLTWNWGYSRSDQYDPGREVLRFTQEGRTSLRRQSMQDGGFSASDDLEGPGVSVGLSREIPQSKGMVSIVGGVNGYWFDDIEVKGSTFAESYSKRSYEVVDTYDVSGMTITQAPFLGTFDGPFDDPPVIPSPVIPNIPSNRTQGRLTSSSDWSAKNQFSIDTETGLYQFWLGPAFSLAPTETFALGIVPSISLNYLDVDVDRSESFLAVYPDGRIEELQRWSDSESESDWLFGAGITLEGELDLGSSFFVRIWGSYEWVSDDVEVTVGPNNTITVDASGYAAGGGVGFRF
ncbi:MAG: hypothetical protein PHF14_01460 [Verrucomicrobiota bacterium]|nr:hypothetical protein [Verrucomicrobiota bacterium]